jgi:hypothetical protein
MAPVQPNFYLVEADFTLDKPQGGFFAFGLSAPASRDFLNA